MESVAANEDTTMPAAPRSLKELFLDALVIAPAERAAWLENECGGDAELRRHVELMLSAHDEPQSLIDRMAPAGAPLEGATGAFATRENHPEPSETEKAGTMIGPFKLLEEIGEGGMGTVWMAEQSEPIHRRVAVKVVKEGMDSKQVLARFEAERQALALMDHPNIARVIDAGTVGSRQSAAAAAAVGSGQSAVGSQEERPGSLPTATCPLPTGKGRPYFVMELVKGLPITRYCDEKRLGVRERLELFGDVCRAVQHAHQKGIIHRDIKPSNVLVAPYDGKPVVKVIDFGVAKATGQRLTEKTLFTGFGAVVGTLEYMSPEQAELNNQDIDTRSDVYSLGVLLYELLTGTTPLERKRLKETGLLEVLRIIREEEVPTPSTRLSTTDELPTVAANRGMEPRKLSGLLRGELDWIVMKALDKDRNRRYETANGFAMDIQRYLVDEPVLACPPSAGYRLRKFVRRHKGPLLAVSAIVLLLVAAVVGTTTGMFWALAAEVKAVQERDDKEKARKEAVEARQETRQALIAMTDPLMEELLGRQVHLTDQSQDYWKKALAIHAAFAAARADDPEGQLSKGDGYYQVARIRHLLGELQEAEAGYREAITIGRKLSGDFPDRADFRQLLVWSYNNLGSVLREIGRAEEARSAYRDALLLGKQLAADYANEPLFRQNLYSTAHQLAMLLQDADRLKDAELVYHDALTIGKQLVADFRDRLDFAGQLALTHHNLGVLLRVAGRFEEAGRNFREALALQERVVERLPHRASYRNDLARTQLNLGILLEGIGRRKEAESAYQEALTLARPLADEFSSRPDYRTVLAMALNSLGFLLHTTSRPRQAEHCYREALILWQRLAADVPDKPELRQDLAQTYNNLGALLRTTNRPEEAEKHHGEALALRRRLVAQYPLRPAYRKELAQSLINLGTVRRFAGRLVEAETAYREALTLRKQLAAEVPLRPDFRNDLARGHVVLASLLLDSRPDEAEAAWREALAVQTQLAADFPRRPEFRQNLAQTHILKATLLDQKGLKQKAESVQREALAVQKQLAADFPRVPDYQNNLAGTLVNIAVLRRQRQDFAGAVALLEEARPHHRAALEARPDSSHYRQFYRNNRWNLAHSYLGLADHARLATTANELARVGYLPANDRYDAACLLCRCMSLAEKDARLDKDKRTELAKGHADRALTLLRQAVALGYKDAAHLKKDPDLMPLRAREEYQKLLAELEGKAKE
jgi:serine/threonine protein kinase/tetratricopeptide (TPR) repeat protein